MAWFGQGKDTIEWEEFRDDVLFYKWPAKEIKKGSKLIIRPGQKAIFYANGRIEGIFEQEGNYDIVSEIVPFLSTLKGVFSLRSDTGLRAEVYFVNSKELLLNWGTRQRIMIPSPDVPSGIPVGCNGNLVVAFRDYQKFIDKIAGIKDKYTLEDISERIMGELNPVIAEAILKGEQAININALVALQQNSRSIGKVICEEIDKELADFGLTVSDLNINSFNYPKEVQQMAERAAGQSFINNVGKYTAIQMADSFDSPSGGNNIAGLGAQVAIGAQIAQQINDVPKTENAAQSGDRFCPTCRKMVNGKFCSNCGTQTV